MGCMVASGIGNLYFIYGIMDKYIYRGILKKIYSVMKLGIQNHFTFYSDNDPKHFSYLARKWSLYNFPKTIKTPTQSPDLNVFPNLWATLD